jgi:hypothetical protein
MHFTNHTILIFNEANYKFNTTNILYDKNQNGQTHNIIRNNELLEYDSETIDIMFMEIAELNQAYTII